ncbi:MAG: hypothetical protein IT429_20930, partial [Gemmataceae bacterium]|nr:hypothetical protein [Gemmataceae bacterium]
MRGLTLLIIGAALLVSLLPEHAGPVYGQATPAPTAAPAGSGPAAPPTCITTTVPSDHLRQFKVPTAEGVTYPDQIGAPDEKRVYLFQVPKTSAAFVYVGDQWYDLDLYLYARGRCAPGTWEALIRNWSVRSERRNLQFVRPDEQMMNLSPDEYALVVGPKFAEANYGGADFDPKRGFTIRVALTPPVCGVEPKDEQKPSPFDPAVMIS